MDLRLVGTWRIEGVASRTGSLDVPDTAWTFHPPTPRQRSGFYAAAYVFEADGTFRIESRGDPPRQLPERGAWRLEEEDGELYLTFDGAGGPISQRVWFPSEGRMLWATSPLSRREEGGRVWLVPGAQGWVKHDRSWLVQFNLWVAFRLVREAAVR
jgi:hypothetical protein